MNSTEQHLSGDLAVDGGVAVCAMGVLSMVTAAFTGIVVGLSVGTYHVLDLNPVVATVLATWVGGWAGLAVGCGMVWRKNYRAARAAPPPPTLEERCETAVARLRREPGNRVAAHAVQEADWALIAGTLRECAQEQSQALRAIGRDPRSFHSQAYLDRFVKEAISAAQRFRLPRDGGRDDIARAAVAERACRAALIALRRRSSGKSTRNYVRVFAEALLAAKSYASSPTGRVSAARHDKVGLQDLFDRVARESVGAEDAPFTLTAERLEQDHALLNLLRQLHLFGSVLEHRDAARPYLDLQAVITQLIRALSPGGDEDAKIASLLLRVQQKRGPFSSAAQTDRAREWDAPDGPDPCAQAVDVIREVSKLRVIEAVISRDETKNA